MPTDPRPNDETVTLANQIPLPMDHDTDEHIIARVVAGDRAAFRHLFDRHYGRSLSVAQGIVLHRSEAEDVVQEAMTKAFKNLTRFDRRASFGTWLYRIVVNTAIQATRRTRHDRHVVTLEAVSDRITDPTGIPQLADPDIESALRRLDPEDRAIIVMFYWEDLSLNEIAGAMECTPNAAKTRLFRARERFRQFYQGGDQ